MLCKTAIDAVDRFTQSHMPYLSIGFLLLGLFAGESAARFAALVPYFFVVIMFNSGLGLRLDDLQSLRERTWVLPLQLAILHLITPALAWAVTSPFYDSETVMGFVVLTMMPISPSCVLWAGIFRSNITLAMALILVDTLAAPFIIPYALQLFSGASVALDPLRMLRGLALMLLAPSLLAIICNRISNGSVQRKAGRTFSLLAKLSIYAILFINGGVTSRFFTGLNWSIAAMAGTVFVLYLFIFTANLIAGKLLFPARGDVIAFMICLSVRSLTTGMVIATTYFAPVATFIVMLGMFYQQPMASFAGKAVDRIFRIKEQAG